MVTAVLAVAAGSIAPRLVTPPDGTSTVAPTTFASAGIQCAPSAGATEQVFVAAGATDKDIIVARVGIASVPGVTIDRYLDREQALDQLRCLFPGPPDRWRGVRSDSLPVSFAITTAGRTDSAARLRAVPNVAGIVTPATWSDWVVRIDR